MQLKSSITIGNLTKASLSRKHMYVKIVPDNDDSPSRGLVSYHSPRLDHQTVSQDEPVFYRSTDAVPRFSSPPSPKAFRQETRSPAGEGFY